MAHRQFQSMFDTIFVGDVTADISSASTGSGTFGSITVAVPGVKIGDVVIVFNYGGVYTAGSPVLGDVSAANTVRLTTLNNSAGTVDYASAKYSIIVLRFIGK